MRLVLALQVLAGVAVLALAVSCGSLPQRSSCFDAVSGTSTGFCDNPDPQDPGQEQPPIPPGGFPPPPSSCGVSSTEEVSYGGLTCTENGSGGRRQPGESCVDPTDCASVCCVPDPSGRLQPAPPVDQGDSGASADASESPDADSDASTIADASDPVPEAGTLPLHPTRIWACSCGVCLSPEEVCANENKGRGLGGP